MATVLGTFSVLKDHVKLKVSQDATRIDNIVFRLHYRATFLALLVATLLVSTKQLVGEHIKCISDEGIPEAVIDTFCFFTSTFTVTKHMNVTMLAGGAIPHPGVGPVNNEDAVVHHVYYQWVPFVLFFQAICFYVPHYLWRSNEGGRLKMLVSGLHMAALSLSDEKVEMEGGKAVPTRSERQEKLEQIRIAFINRLHANRPWAYYLSLCEVLNFVNVLGQIYVTDLFLGGAFLGLGESVAQADFGEAMNPLDIVFPKVTKCTFHKYGPSGTIQKHDALCVMALNIVNEKIYTFLWFWFIILAIVTGLGLVWRILTMLLHARSKAFNKLVFSMACPGKYNPWSVLRVTNEYYFGDWLFLYYIAKNLDNYAFKDLLEQLGHDMEDRRAARFRRTFGSVTEEEPLKQRTVTSKDVV
ncbi:innexin inx7-like [Venturia canescens]|uniref:innexin inx7-like n=1 Tax=Venturia canescens TaxID=32260 RepID=UPI001C9BDDFF|nr:innexin inx7-like [Venturia canescens]